MPARLTPRAAAAAALAAAALFAPAPAPAFPAGAPRFSEETALPSAGFSFSGMQGAAQKPVKPPEIRRWRFSRGDEEWFEDRSDATELWRAAQTVGTWEDRAGNVLAVAKARAYLSPALAEEGDVGLEAFADAMSDPADAVLPTDGGDELAPWVARFTGCGIAGRPQALPIHPSRLAKVWEFPLDDPAARAWALRLNPTRAGGRAAARDWYVFFLSLARAPAAGDVRELDRTLRGDLLGSVRPVGLAAASADGGRIRARAPVPGEGEPIDDERREQALASVAALDDWWAMESEHYVLLSDDPAGERSADALLSGLERLRRHYAALVPPFARTIDSTSVVRVFRKDEDYVSYLRDPSLPMRPEDTAGVFSGARRELVIRPQRRASATDAASVVRHEGFHQYLFSAWGGVAPSIWFNEGFAEFFASYKPKGDGRFEWSENKWEAEFLERAAASRDLDWTALLRAMLFWDQATFYDPPLRGGASASYAFAYGLAYFLARGAPFVRNKPYRDVLPVYMAAIEETGNPVAATLEAFRLGPRGDDTEFLSRLARDLREFWRSPSARRNAARSGLSAAGMAPGGMSPREWRSGRNAPSAFTVASTVRGTATKKRVRRRFANSRRRTWRRRADWRQLRESRHPRRIPLR